MVSAIGIGLQEVQKVDDAMYIHLGIVSISVYWLLWVIKIIWVCYLDRRTAFQDHQ